MEEVELDATSMARLRLEAEQAVWSRTAIGPVMYALFSFAISATSTLGAERAVFAWSLTAIVVAAGTTRVLLLGPPSAERGPAWRRAFAVLTSTMVLAFGVTVAAAIHWRGVGFATMLTLVASTGVAAGVSRAFAPWLSLLRVGVSLLRVPSFVAALALGTREGAWLAALVAVEFGYLFWLGKRLNSEFWRAAADRARLERAHREVVGAQRQMRDLIERTPDAIGILQGNVIVFANAAWRAVLQRSEAEVVGQEIISLLHEGDRAAFERFASSVDPGAPREFRFVRKDGASVLLEIIRTEEFQYGGALARLVAARDVTERSRLRERVARSERLASIGTLAAGVAHEINNPLTYVLANLEYMRERLADDADSERSADLQQVVDEAYAGADRVRVIVRDLKTFSRPKSGRLMRVSVNEVLELSLKMAAHELRHRARVVCELGPVPVVAANEPQLGQVFLNLLVNAAQALGDGDPEKHEVRVSSRVGDAGQVVVEIADTGEGIDAADLPHIFDPFFTTKPVGIGTGLGLAISHAAVRSFGGELTVESERGRGSKFIVTLPVTPVASRDSAPPSMPMGRGRARILVVDDEPAVGASLERALREDCDLVFASSGAAALVHLMSGAPFDLVLCDVMMPEMTGMQLYERTVEQAPHGASRFVFMTGGAFTDGAREFLGRVPNRCIDKPFDLRELRRLIETRLSA